jgi:CubicO group peptidase (beta-lactamase class C family)
MQKVMKTIFLISVISLLNICCNRSYSDHYPYIPPEDIGDGLQTGSLEEANIDTQMILKAVGRIRNGKYGEVHSMLIYKDDMLVLEEYFKGHRYQWDAPQYHGELVQWDRTMFHQIMSCTKSYTSACIGIAIEKGFIKSVKQSVFEYLPDYQVFNAGGKNKITIEHLLTMTSGLQWNEWNAPHGTAANDIDRLYFECGNDPIYCVLERPLVSEPGESFTYNGGGLIILGEILKNATNMDIDEFSMKYLFGPLGIDSTEWSDFPNGMIESASSLKIRPRDMMKLGATYLKEGVWNGKRIIPSEWVEKSSVIYNNNKNIKLPIEDSGKNGYGYTWWISEVGKRSNKTKMYRANGWGGQVIMVLPEKNMVVVFTAGNYASRSPLFKILERYILPAVNE